MRQTAHVFAAALAAALVASIATPARAEYCRTKACDNHLGYDDVWQTEPDPPCDTTQNGCRLEGMPLFWPKSCLSFAVQQDGSKTQGIDYETTHQVVEDAFTTWLSADCGNGATPSFRIDDLSPATCNHPEYNSDQGNANVFLFRDNDWPHADSFDTLALTTITYNRENAQIFDADVEINSFQADFTLSDQPGQIHDDLLAVLTHEAGHFLGLSHDDNGNATMFATYMPGYLTQRDLYQTDIEGICAIYPPDQPISTKECVPRHGYLRTCAVTETSGCGIAADHASHRRSAAFVALVGLGLVLRRGRARRIATQRRT